MKKSRFRQAIDLPYDKSENPDEIDKNGVTSIAAVMIDVIIDVGLLENDEKYANFMDDINAAFVGKEVK